MAPVSAGQEGETAEMSAAVLALGACQYFIVASGSPRGSPLKTPPMVLLDCPGGLSQGTEQSAKLLGSTTPENERFMAPASSLTEFLSFQSMPGSAQGLLPDQCSGSSLLAVLSGYFQISAQGAHS